MDIYATLPSYAPAPLYFNNSTPEWAPLLNTWNEEQFDYTIHGETFLMDSAAQAFIAAHCRDLAGVNEVFLIHFHNLTREGISHLDLKELLPGDLIKLMKDVLWAKFMQCPVARDHLLNTGRRDIYYFNTDDTFWGTAATRDDNGYEGDNHLGKILMDIRSMLHLTKIRSTLQEKHYE